MRLWIIMAAALPLAACNGTASSSTSGTTAEASGAGTARSFQVSDFTSVDLRGHDDIDVRVGGAFAVRAEGPSEELDRLEIKKDGSTLKVGRVNQSGFNWGNSDGKSVKIYVTMPSISGASIAGAGDMSVDKVSGGDFDGSIAGSGDLKLGALNANAAKFSIAGSGDISATGTVQRLDVNIAGSGGIEAKGLKASEAKISIAGSGDVEANVEGAADVNILGSGSVNVGPKAKCKTSKMGSGEVRCG